ncbi:MAG: hypothetical protein K0R52_77 [Alphaproteobacteria bacterium]|nr:hypothetical protein [Alphaproteobacteria bacterium]
MGQYVMVIMVCSLLGACGKKGPTEPLEQSDYPRTYPKPSGQEPFPPKKPAEKGCCCDDA